MLVRLTAKTKNKGKITLNSKLQNASLDMLFPLASKKCLSKQGIVKIIAALSLAIGS